MRYDQIQILAGHRRNAVDRHQCDDVIEEDTVAQAKRRARHVLTDDYQALIESSEPLRFARVMGDGQVLAEYYRPLTVSEKANLKRVRAAVTAGLTLSDGTRVTAVIFEGGDWHFQQPDDSHWFLVEPKAALTDHEGKPFRLV